MIYRGPARSVSMLAQLLEEEGVQVSYAPPMETKSLSAVAETVVVSILCNGAYDLVKAGVVKFRASSFGCGSDAEIERTATPSRGRAALAPIPRHNRNF